MARPDAPGVGELKTQRLNLFVSPDEMKAIDDWRFANRVSSLSEAVRRLCKIGMAAEPSLMERAK